MSLARLFPWVTCLVLGLIIWGLQNQLTAERDFRSSVQAQLHAPSNSAATLSDFLTAAIQTRDAQIAALNDINKSALASKQRSDAADAQLELVQEANQHKVDALQGELTTLKTRKSAGNLLNDCVVIEEDSKLPWEGWHQ